MDKTEPIRLKYSDRCWFEIDDKGKDLGMIAHAFPNPTVNEAKHRFIVEATNTAADQSRVIAVLTEALEATARASRQTLDIIQKENFVFDGSGDRWEKLAFTIYTELTQASTDAKDALAEAQRILEGE